MEKFDRLPREWRDIANEFGVMPTSDQMKNYTPEQMRQHLEKVRREIQLAELTK
jgi:hypothetical protein